MGAAAGAGGDIFAFGHVGIKHGRLSFQGTWAKPSDRDRCPDEVRRTDDAAGVWQYLARDKEGCGPISFYVCTDKLEGEWRPVSWPAQESWDVKWAAPTDGARGPKCSATASTAGAGIPTCASLRSNTLLRIPVPVPSSCDVAQNTQFDLAAASPSTATGL